MLVSLGRYSYVREINEPGTFLNKSGISYKQGIFHDLSGRGCQKRRYLLWWTTELVFKRIDIWQQNTKLPVMKRISWLSSKELFTVRICAGGLKNKYAGVAKLEYAPVLDTGGYQKYRAGSTPVARIHTAMVELVDQIFSKNIVFQKTYRFESC